MHNLWSNSLVARHRFNKPEVPGLKLQDSLKVASAFHLSNVNSISSWNS